MKLVALAALLLSGCIFVLSDGNDPPDAAPAPGIDADPGDPDCPEPQPGKAMICGTIINLVTSDVVHQPMRVSFYDALKLATEAPPPPPFMVTMSDSSGRYRSIDGSTRGVTTATFIAVTVDDPGSGDVWITTAVAGPGTAGILELPAFATPRSSVFQPFEADGGLLMLFLDPAQGPVGPFDGAPTAGVTPSGAAGMVQTFSNTDPLVRTDLVDGNVSGPNGSLLLTQAPIDEYSGTSPGHTWSTALGGSTPGLIWVATRISL